MSIYKGPIIFKGLVLKATPTNFMLPNKLFWETSLWGLKGGVLINGSLQVFVLQYLTIGIEINLRVNVFPHCEMKSYL
jgi:hypothetical protein